MCAFANKMGERCHPRNKLFSDGTFSKGEKGVWEEKVGRKFKLFAGCVNFVKIK